MSTRTVTSSGCVECPYEGKPNEGAVMRICDVVLTTVMSVGLRDPPPKFGYPASTPGSPIECHDRLLRETVHVKKELILTREELAETQKDLSKPNRKLTKKDKERKSFAREIWNQGKGLMKEAKDMIKK
ncbi:hypothetical protein L1987_32949 [Smallanthus sonchifolius]|uniref:Uncharacterized protein n=1 Tax=Smallanthus sonchifolius TaxID=185202 RepID=A0ACB9HQW4_9ASTR|nr:hypothetical protein L1987_32949 [Smallanthus sonchifolius]